MSEIDKLFAKLRKENRQALMPFVTAGDPDLAFTADVLKALDDCGCHLCELGIPYSDPIADGPVIQASYTRALQQGLRLDAVLQMMRKVVPSIQLPVVTMVSYAIVCRHGVERYVSETRAAGAAGAIVPDLPVEEADEMIEICREADFSLIQLIAPTTPRPRARQIAATSSGFLYYVSVTGITGERDDLPADLVANVSWLREQTDLPICIGFGISRPEHVQRLASVADGLIVGSAIVRRIAQASDKPRDEVLADVAQYVKSLLAAL